MSDKIALPTLDELVSDSEKDIANNALMVLLNQAPPVSWLKDHPTAKVKDKEDKNVPLKYLPIGKIEYLLTKLYTRWWVEIREVKPIANSCVVTVRVNVINPITKEHEWQDGVGASPIQTDSGAGAMDWNAVKAHGVMISAPAAETYAIKDAAEKFGKIFGRDLGKKESVDYDHLLKLNKVTVEDLSLLYDMKKAALTKEEKEDAERVIKNKEVKSYSKIHRLLMSKI
jgi:hypothetical protein